jgi:hypothetical protein
MTLATFEIGLPEALQPELLNDNAGMGKWRGSTWHEN